MKHWKMKNEKILLDIQIMGRYRQWNPECGDSRRTNFQMQVALIGVNFCNSFQLIFFFFQYIDILKIVLQLVHIVWSLYY